LSAVTTTLVPWLRALVPPAKDAVPREFKMHFFWDKEATHIKFFAIDVLAAVIGVAVGAAYVVTKHWVLSNVLGLAFSISGITFLSLGSYKVGAILLMGLFVYDVFWVFGTDVMVTVAKSFDAPIKLLFPRDIFAAEFKHAMLGLGDIVIPGIFVALLARFDKAQATRNGVTPASFPTPYFNVTFVAYIVGLVTTIAIMHFFKAAQPALLYLVPACLGASLLLAVVRGELTQLFAYNEEEPEQAKKTD
jgi:minor histocompatibility antigen H13